MIYIKCKTCGWRLPFSSKTNEDDVKNKEIGNIICPNCGKTLIQIKYLQRENRIIKD